MEKDGYIQIGEAALRDPLTGGFLPSVPLYVKETDCAPDANGGLIADIGKLFADRMRQYAQECANADASI